MAKTLFKGIKTVQRAGYTAVSAADRKGYIWFVRPDDAADGTVGDIYFGNRHYASVDEAGQNKIKSALDGFLGADSKTVKAYVDDIIAGLDVACVQEAGKPIISVCQTDGVVSAAVGTINAEFVNIADTGSTITATTVEGALQEIATEINNMDLSEVGGTGKMITTISETDGVVSATAIDATAANIAIADSGDNFAGTTVEAALAELADKAEAQEISSADKTITITTGANGTDVSVNIDEATIVKDANGVLSTNLQISAVTTSDTNVKEAYALVDASGATHGATIKIYKDSALQEVELVDLHAEPEDWPSGQTYHDGQYLRFDYLNANGGHDIVYLDVSTFLIEAEFASGVTVTNGIAHGVVDPTSETFLTVGANGFKLDGVQGAINSAVNALDVTGDSAVAGQYVAAIEETDGLVAVKSRANVSEAHLNGYTKGSDGSAVASGDSINDAISKLENQVDNAKAAATTVVESPSGNVHVTVSSSTAADGHNIYTVNESDIASASGLSDEIAARKAVDGQAGQTYAANTGANYISEATSLNDADVKLDTAIKNIADSVYTGVTAGNGISATAVANRTQTVSIKPEASTDNTVAAGHIELGFNNDGAVYGLMYYDDGDPEA